MKLALRQEKTKQARVIYLDRKNKLIADEIVGRGSVDLAPLEIKARDHCVVGASATISMKAKRLI